MPDSQRVFVLDTNRQPLMPCHPARARELLREKKAAVWRRYPFTIILKEREGGDTQPIQIKIDPGSKTTGIALVGDFKRGKKVLWGANLTHRGLTLKAFGFPVEVGTGGRTKFNRTQQGFTKDHWIDAACVGESGEKLRLPAIKPLQIKCMGRGSRQACRTDKHGFPNKWRTRQKGFFGFQTGDMVRADVPSGKNAGHHTGRVSVRAKGSFALAIKDGKKDGIPHRFFRSLQRQDGYSYA